MFMDKDGQTLASEILKEVKASARRWFIAFCIMCSVELGTVAGFLWYISLPVEECSVDQITDTGGDNCAVGGDYTYGTAADILQETEQ